MAGVRHDNWANDPAKVAEWQARDERKAEGFSRERFVLGPWNGDQTEKEFVKTGSAGITPLTPKVLALHMEGDAGCDD